ncbi:hypothetical protein PanWU01x14_290400 [Parasponia andersonii]|uniref:Uncharacterized protein n=1 Tax=Parasponia andersonii TaxID=3476 RepID=A0A2P5AXX2_PARAD|nr:hypothetical protein PanWU01x14_290400 [Parasponia andersonii]
MDTELEIELHVQTDIVDKVSSQVENFSFNDFFIDFELDKDSAKEEIRKSLVGKFFAKKPLKWFAENGYWENLAMKLGWKIQEVNRHTFVFRFT